ncbi:hypothetical protein C8J56DRAFT_955946 [Mycena floridula]|nr:hypothetical protein C8J56DRAFT_955946 [Mycena floridula]
MPASELSRSVRAVLENALPATELIPVVEDFVLDCSSSQEREVLLFSVEKELQDIHCDVVDHSLLSHTEIFLLVLHHLTPILPSISIISSWFDLVLRPALREPKLPPAAVAQGNRSHEQYPQKITEFTRQLFDLYLLDTFNEGSSHDILEYAQLSDQSQREKRLCWKRNLEAILLQFGHERPQDFMTEVYCHFATPSTRLQLIMLLDVYSSKPTFIASVPEFASHPLMTSLLHSLLLDNSSTVASIGLVLFSKLLPMLAIHAPTELKLALPTLLAILARMVCWKERSPSDILLRGDDSDTTSLELRGDLEWQRLELTFDGTVTSSPSPRRFYSCLYYLFPCNLLRFLREPIVYMSANNFQSPYTVGWDVLLDEDHIRTRSEPLIRGHGCHRAIIWRDADAELTSTDLWAGYDVAQMASEAALLDIRTRIIATKEALKSTSSEGTVSDDGGLTTRPRSPHEDYEEDQPQPISLISASPSTADDQIPEHALEAIAQLQRELLLLRSEFNFQVWLSAENVKHIGRLFKDRVLSKTAEAERQALGEPGYNKLRNYRAEVVRLKSELTEHKQQASSNKGKFTDWNAELTKKLRDLREEKKLWEFEAATLKTAEKEAKALFAAQEILLSDALKEVTDLKTQQKETQHKIDRLRDYEKQIEQHTKMQRLWDEDFARFNARGEEMQQMQSLYKQMAMRLESYEKVHGEMEESARALRRQNQALEVRAQHAKQTSPKSINDSAVKFLKAENVALKETNETLREQNHDLRDEIEELRAMVEVLKGEVSQLRGQVSPT